MVMLVMVLILMAVFHPLWQGAKEACMKVFSMAER